MTGDTQKEREREGEEVIEWRTTDTGKRDRGEKKETQREGNIREREAMKVSEND